MAQSPQEPQDSSVTEDGMTAAQAVDRIEAAAHPRPHDRRLHARGAVYDARFVPTGRIAGWTTASCLTGEADAVIRFSNGSGNFAADDRARGVRGMAVKFLEGDGSSEDAKAVMDLVAANFRVFPSHNPEGFIELVEALGMAGTEGGFTDRAKGKLAAAGKFATVLAQHPESRGALKSFAGQQAPVSFATTRYDGLHAFVLVDEAGVRRPFRYRLVPQLGEVEIDPAYAATLAPDFLIGDLDARLATGPVTFTVVYQFAEPNDPTHDPSQAWPEHRPLIPAGHLHVTARSPREDHWQQQVFDPTRLAPGVEASDDKMLAFRRHAYSVSAERRLAP
ncbi:catalase [Streptomyces sp. R08]|uniref:Catalase-related peroxidase n=1 Tax=Streptomyces sp. R08 TaxID=3238624 RepID=A0AB39M1D9_9ACTN